MHPRRLIVWIACAALAVVAPRLAIRRPEAATSPPSTATASDQPGRHELILNGLVFGRATWAIPPLPSSLTQPSRVGGRRLWVVQFDGPIRNAWHSALRTAGLDVVSYVAPYAYIVWGDEPALLAALEAGDRALPVSQSGEYLPAYRVTPSLRAQLSQTDLARSVDILVQRYRGPDAPALGLELEALVRAKGGTDLRVGVGTRGFVSRAFRVPVAALGDIARLPTVYSVSEWRPPSLHDERQGQILAGAVLTATGRAIPVGPGYLAFLAARGFSQSSNAYPIVAVTDDGVDSGEPAAIAHPDLHVRGLPNLPSRVSFSLNCTLDSAANDIGGHGTLNAGIIAGYNDLGAAPYRDADGYALGLGIAPHGRVANVKLFANSGAFDLSLCGQTLEQFVREAYMLGATISSNSWGIDSGGVYDAFAQAYDALTRDADDDPSNGLQEYLHVFSAGNAGPESTTIGSPATAKNVIAVGATENVREDGVLDGCQVSAAADADTLADFSSRGPTADGRVKPDVVAPGTHIQGPATQEADFSGASVCGGPGGAPYHPPNQTLYTWSSGTSHAAPAIAGAAALAMAHYSARIHPGIRPSPAMVKALLANAPRTIGAASPMDDAFGWGMPELSRMFDGLARLALDQQHVFTESGQVLELDGRIGDANRPFRVTLAWTDAPGSTVGPAYVNDLDLEVRVGGSVYRGNVFGALGSLAGGQADSRNNVESVFLPPGAAGDVQIRVLARNIAGDGVPGNASPLDQDFALVVYNPEAGYVSGNVSDAQSGMGIEGARVAASAAPTATMSAIADATGDWVMAVRPGAYTFTASAYGYTSAEHPAITVARGSHHTLTFGLMLAPTAVVSGFVTDAVTGLPVIGQVMVRGDISDPPNSATPTDDSTGLYRVALAAGQAYTLGFESALHATAHVRIAALMTDTAVNVALTPITASGGVLGVVTDATDGAPIGSARIELRPGGAETTTGTDGRYLLLGVSPATYEVITQRQPRAPVTTSVVVSQSRLTRLDVALPSSKATWTTRYISRAIEYGAQVTDTWRLGNDGTASLSFALAPMSVAPAWLTLNPSAGMIAPGADMSLTLAWAASGVGQPGIYTGTLALAFNDPRTPQLDVSARLQVDPSPSLGRVRGRVTSLGACDLEVGMAPTALLTAGSADGFNATITPAPDGSYSHYLPSGAYTLSAQAADHVSQSARVDVAAGAATRTDFALRLDAPCLQFSPAVISEVVPLGAAMAIPITIQNRGPSALHVRAFTSLESTGAATMTRGGPDSFGYTWRASADAAGPAYAWIAPGDGAKLRLSDDSTALVILPFEFPFYDLRTSRIGVSNNGAIFARDAGGTLDWVNQPLTSTTAPAYLIAPFWDDLDGVFGSVHATVLTGTQPARVVISWVNRPHFDLEGLATFQAVLFADGAILFQYADTDFGVPAWDSGTSATIGIKGADAFHALEFSHMSPSAPNRSAVCFRRPLSSDCGAEPVPWLSSTASISVEPESAGVITVALDTAPLAQPGPVAARLNLFNNSPVAVVGLPVRALAPVPADFGRVTGNVGSARGCGDGRAPLPGAALRSDAWPRDLASGHDGAFDVWLPSGPQSIVIQRAGFETVTRTVVVRTDAAVGIDVALRALEPCGSVEPSAGITVALTPGGIATRELAIANTGPSPMDWRIAHDTPMSAPASPADLIRDGGFENTPLSFEGGEWGADSFRFGTPLCTTLPPFYCGVGSGTTGPRTGAWFVWLFGSARGDFGSISQTIHISHGAALLVFHAWVGVPGEASDGVRVLMDDEVVGGVPITAPTQGYAAFEIDVSRFANDRPHTLSFVYTLAPRARVSIDDVSLLLVEPHACDTAGGWLSVTPGAGRLAGDGAAVARAVLRADGLDPGARASVLCVLTDDPRRSRHFVPVALQVVPAHHVYVPALVRP